MFYPIPAEMPDRVGAWFRAKGLGTASIQMGC